MDPVLASSQDVAEAAHVARERGRLGIDCGPGCMGGAAGRGSMTVGRDVALCLRNIGGKRVGEPPRR